MSDPLLSASNVGVHAGGRPILSPLSLNLYRGAFTVLIGQSGAGKSTLLRVLSGELAPSSGEVLLDGVPLKRLDPLSLSARRAVLSQANRLAFPFLVREVVALGLEAGGGSVPRAARPALVEHFLARVGLGGFANRAYNTLSGGEQQRVHMARVLAQVAPEPKMAAGRLLFLDEPTSSLDLKHQIGILELARAFTDAGGAVLAVLHDVNLASRFADSIVALKRGEMVAQGEPSSVLSASGIEDIFDIGLCVNRGPVCRRPFVLPFPPAGE